MNKKTLPIVLMLTLLCSTTFGQQTLVKPLNSKLEKLIDSYVRNVDGKPRPVMPTKINDYSIYSITFTGAKMGHIERPRRYKKFNPKRDNISDVVVTDQNYSSNKYFLSVVHKNGKACDMNEFNIRIEANNLECTEAGNFSNYNIAGSIWDYLDGSLPMEGDIVITHIETGLSTKVHYAFNVMPSQYNWRGTDGAFLYELVTSESHPNYHTILNLSNGTMYATYGDTKINVSGRDGRNGRDGLNGLNGINTYTRTKKDGSKVKVNGTCGTAGGNGGDGENGENGGNAYVMVGSGCGSSLKVMYGGGKGGRGGAAGIGGKHGVGSPCRGRAPNGIPGRNGIAGSDGSCQFTYLNCTNLLHDYYMNGAQIIRKYPIIQVDKSVKFKKKSRNLKKRIDKRISEEAVDF